MKNITISHLQQMKQTGEKICMLTAYDATFAHVLAEAGVEVILVGDSLGMVVKGQSSTLGVTVQDIAYHTANVRRANTRALIVADLPFLSYATLELALESSLQVMQAGAHMVKLEGGANLAPIVKVLAEHGVPTCIHLGLTPQSVNVFGGYKVHGKTGEQAAKMLQNAKTVQDAGAAMLLLECVVQDVAKQITNMVDIPVIGIGAGVDVDGQVLVLHDMLGLSLSGKTAKFVRNFMMNADSIAVALSSYVEAVKSKSFPDVKHCYD